MLLDPNNRVCSRARALGADMKYIPGSKVFNTLPAHTLLHWTQAKYGAEKANSLHEVLFRKYHSEGLNLGPNEELLKASEEVGLPVEEVEAMLKSGELTAQVKKEVQQGRRVCSGVPFFQFPNGHVISGGVDPEEFAGALQACASA
jgi:predicted DsbA family dithiol-disulfide isomerase